MVDLTYPEVDERERRELEREAGHPLLTLEAVHKFRRRQLTDRALDNLLDGFRSENRRRSRRDD